MFNFTPTSEWNDIKAIVFMYKSTEQLRNRHIQEEKFEQAAEDQVQLRQLKQNLFEILMADRFSIEQGENKSIILKSNV